MAFKQYVHSPTKLEYYEGIKASIASNGRVTIRKEHEEEYEEVEIPASVVYKIAKAAGLIKFTKAKIVLEHFGGIHVEVNTDRTVNIQKEEGDHQDEVIIPMAFVFELVNTLQVTKKIIYTNEPFVQQQEKE